jgi:hypothetical protein
VLEEGDYPSLRGVVAPLSLLALLLARVGHALKIGRGPAAGSKGHCGRAGAPEEAVGRQPHNGVLTAAPRPILRCVNHRQRKRLHDLRKAHGPAPDRPRLVLRQETYSKVKQPHIVPVTYQRSFSVHDRVAVHVPGKAEHVELHIENAGTRSRFYRRVRPNGEEIDDIEATLAYVETKSASALTEVAMGAELTATRKEALVQFLGIQMLRGPAFFSTQHENVERFVPKTLTEADVKPALLEQTGGDLELAREKVVELFRQPTQQLLRMTTIALKVAAVLGSMRWHLLHFDDPLLAYSDQPVVVWPLDIEMFNTVPTEPSFGPVGALEVQVPLSPYVGVLMTWADLPDPVEPVTAPAPYAGEMNALVIAQADKQWMHRIGSEPPVAAAPIRPLSRAFEDRYTADAVRASRRRATTAQYLHRVRNRRFINDIQVVTVSAA